MDYDPTVDVLDDPNIRNCPFMGKVEHCLPIVKPKSILRVRHQNGTNTCCAFAATATIFGAEMKHKGHAVPGSVQELVDYAPLYKRPKVVTEPGPYEVPPEGHLISYRTAFLYTRDHGLTPEKHYKFIGKCKFGKRKWHGGPWDGKVTNDKDEEVEREKKIFIGGYKHVERKDIKAILLEQPVTGVICLTKEFQKWKGQEIYNVDGGDPNAKHAVTVVGYGCENGLDYFLCQNSYGLKWGFKGYIKVAERLVSHTYVPYLVGEKAGVSPLKDDVCCGQGLGKRKRDVMIIGEDSQGGGEMNEEGGVMDLNEAKRVDCGGDDVLKGEDLGLTRG